MLILKKLSKHTFDLNTLFKFYIEIHTFNLMIPLKKKKNSNATYNPIKMNNKDKASELTRNDEKW